MNRWPLLNTLFVLPHRCQILGLVNKTSPQSMSPTWSEHVFSQLTWTGNNSKYFLFYVSDHRKGWGNRQNMGWIWSLDTIWTMKSTILSQNIFAWRGYCLLKEVFFFDKKEYYFCQCDYNRSLRIWKYIIMIISQVLSVYWKVAMVNLDLHCQKC